MLFKKIKYRKKILFSMLFVITALFLLYAFADFFVMDKLRKANEANYKNYNSLLTEKLENDNLNKEEIFLSTIANYAVTVMEDPKQDVLNCQTELGKFLCTFYDYKLLTKTGKQKIIEKYFVPKNQLNAYKNELKYVFWTKNNNNKDLLNSSSDALFFTLDSLKILKEANSSLVKSVFIETANNLCIAYPVKSIISLEDDFVKLARLSKESNSKTISFINNEGDLILGVRFKESGIQNYDFVIAAVIDYQQLMENICNYAWKQNVDAALLIDAKGDVIFYKYKKNITEFKNLAHVGMNVFTIKDKKTNEASANIVKLQKDRNGFFFFTVGEKDFYVGFSTVSDINWKFMFITTSDDIDSVISDLKLKLNNEQTYFISSFENLFLSFQGILFVVLAIIFIIFIVISLSLSGRLSRSITILHNGVEKISKGDLSYKIPMIKSGDEIEKLISAFNGMVDSINKYIKDLASAIKEKQEAEADIKVAAGIQNSILPKNLVIPEENNTLGIELASTLVPSKTISGDFYDYFLIDNEHLFFAVGDVSGKGVPASLFTMTIKTLLKEYIIEEKTSLKEKILRLNKSIARDNPSCTFVTLFTGILNLKTGIIEYSIAGHEKPVVFNAKDKEIVSFAGRNGMILGVFNKKVNFIFNEIKLNTSDVFVLFTDGVTEAVNDDHKFFERKNIEKVVTKYANKKTDEIIEAVKEAVVSFTGKPVSDNDDFTVLVIKRNK